MLLLVIVGLDAAAEELHESGNAEVVTARRYERFSVTALQYIVWLRIDPEGLQRVVGVDLAEAFEHFPRIGRDPFVLGKHLLIVGKEGHDHIVVAEYIEHLRVGPYAGFHLAAVYASVPREIDEERFADLCGVCFGLLEIEKSFQSVGQVEKVAVLGFASVCGQQHTCIAAC